MKIDTFNKFIKEKNESIIILVDNSKANDVPTIRPSIKKVKLKLKRIIEGETTLSPKIYVVDFDNDEVYLHRHEFKYVK